MARHDEAVIQFEGLPIGPQATGAVQDGMARAQDARELVTEERRHMVAREGLTVAFPSEGPGTYHDPIADQYGSIQGIPWSVAVCASDAISTRDEEEEQEVGWFDDPTTGIRNGYILQHVPSTQRNEKRFTYRGPGELEIPVIGDFYSDNRDLGYLSYGFDENGVKVKETIGAGGDERLARSADRIPPTTPRSGIVETPGHTPTTPSRGIVETPQQRLHFTDTRRAVLVGRGGETVHLQRQLRWSEDREDHIGYRRGEAPHVRSLERLATDIRYIVLMGEHLVRLKQWLRMHSNRVFRRSSLTSASGIARIAMMVEHPNALEPIYVDFNSQKYELLGFVLVSTKVGSHIEGQRIQVEMALGGRIWDTMLRDECATGLLASIVTMQLAADEYVHRTSAYVTNQQSAAMKKTVLGKQGELLAYMRRKYNIPTPSSRGSRMLVGHYNSFPNELY